MKRSTLRATAASLLCIGLLAASTAAFAQEPPKTPQDTRNQPAPEDKSAASTQSLMKKCVQRERATDSTKSESEAQQICQDAMRAKRENRDNEPKSPHHP
ncbi:MAG: hypothetical protein JSR66_12965 [Proteobacteria bacterium]|nr:hypothetical protein [Pseudomonadota bacterium]